MLLAKTQVCCSTLSLSESTSGSSMEKGSCRELKWLRVQGCPVVHDTGSHWHWRTAMGIRSELQGVRAWGKMAQSALSHLWLGQSTAVC